MSANDESPPTPPADAASSPPLRTTLRLVAGAQQGKPEAWEALEHRIGPWLRSVIARSKLPQHLSPEDLAQVVLEEVYRTFGRFLVEEGASFRAWVVTIAEMRIKDARRREQARDNGQARSLEAVGSDALGPLSSLRSSEPLSVTGAARANEFAADLARAVQTLNAKQRMVVELRLIEELSFDEIATRMGMRTEENARSLFHRTKLVLRELLKEHE